MSIDKSDVTGIVLCGGQGARLNGQDKPLLRLGNRQIIDYILDGLVEQVGRCVISCSRNVALYEAKGHQVIVDSDVARGPLAGLCESFQFIETEWVLTVPGDSPFLATNLVSVLSTDATRQGVAVPDNGEHRQNLYLLIDTLARDDLCRFYDDGGKAVKYWLNHRQVKSTDMTDQATSFFNINTPQELNLAHQMLN